MGRFTYKYPRPAVTVDLAVFGFDGESIRVLLVKRKRDPFAGRWAIPGGFVEIEEPFEVAARRELREETGLDVAGPLDFLGVFGKPGRDPRGRTISMAHATAVRGTTTRVRGGDDAAEAAWIALDEAKGLAFDHDEILALAREWLSLSVSAGPVGLAMLPGRFTKDHVTGLHRAVYGDISEARGWGRRMAMKGLVRSVESATSVNVTEFLTKPLRSRPTLYTVPFVPR